MKNWLDNAENHIGSQSSNLDQVDWGRVIPFILLHLVCLFGLITGVSTTAIIICIVSYLIRMFAITAFYHRYFSHKSFKTHRLTQFLFAFLGTTATQRGPLWWAAHHRHHHIHSDTEADSHSPKAGFWNSHMLWFLNKRNFPTKWQRIKDFAQYKELRWLDRFDIIPPILFATMIFILGIFIENYFPEAGASRWQILIWGYFISTLMLAHVTYSINSVAHRWGSKRFDTHDESRNNFFLAILTLGEGWHNNHHKFPSSARQGIYWWEFDLSYYLLCLMKAMGLIWDVKKHDLAKVNQEQVTENSAS